VQLLWEWRSFSIFSFGVPNLAIKKPLDQESIRIAVIPACSWRESIWDFFQMDTCHKHAGMTKG
jgi:hypothetical protein